MSGHADTIRWLLPLWHVGGTQGDRLLAALNALETENQQQAADRDSWRNIAEQLKHTESVELREARTENQRLRDALELIADSSASQQSRITALRALDGTA